MFNPFIAVMARIRLHFSPQLKISPGGKITADGGSGGGETCVCANWVFPFSHAFNALTICTRSIRIPLPFHTVVAPVEDMVALY